MEGKAKEIEMNKGGKTGPVANPVQVNAAKKKNEQQSKTSKVVFSSRAVVSCNEIKIRNTEFFINIGHVKT